MLQDKSNQNEEQKPGSLRTKDTGKLDPVFNPSNFDVGNETEATIGGSPHFTASWAFQFSAGVTTGLVLLALIATVVLTLFPM